MLLLSSGKMTPGSNDSIVNGKAGGLVASPLRATFSS